MRWRRRLCSVLSGLIATRAHVRGELGLMGSAGRRVYSVYVVSAIMAAWSVTGLLSLVLLAPRPGGPGGPLPIGGCGMLEGIGRGGGGIERSDILVIRCWTDGVGGGRMDGSGGGIPNPGGGGGGGGPPRGPKDIGGNGLPSSSFSRMIAKIMRSFDPCGAGCNLRRSRSNAIQAPGLFS